MIVGERLEKFDRLRFVIVAPSCRLGLTGPKYGGVLGMPLFKRISVLCVPRIVECPHELKIVLFHVILPKYAGRLLKQVLAIGRQRKPYTKIRLCWAPHASMAPYRRNESDIREPIPYFPRVRAIDFVACCNTGPSHPTNRMPP